MAELRSIAFNILRIWAIYRQRKYTVLVLFLSLPTPLFNVVRSITGFGRTNTAISSFTV